MTTARSYIDQLLNPDPARPRTVIKSPYTLGYEAAAADHAAGSDRDPRQSCPWPLHLPKSEQWYDGYANFHADQRRAGLVVAE
jgi:hypothetical protein